MKKIIKKYREMISYLIVGVLTTVVSMAAYYCCVFTFLNPENPIELQMANVISWILAVAFAYVANRKVVFQSKNNHVWKEVADFVGSRLLTLIVDMLLMFVCVSICGWNDKIIKILVQGFVVVLNYVLGKFYVFRKRTEEHRKNY